MYRWYVPLSIATLVKNWILVDYNRMSVLNVPHHNLAITNSIHIKN